MLHHAFLPLGGAAGKFAKDLLEALAAEKGLHVDFVSISNTRVYQSDSFGSNVVTHRLNVYKGKTRGWTADELYEYQAKCHIFILRTSRNIRYNLIHAMGQFPESYTAYTFRTRFPYFMSLLPWDAAAAKLLTQNRPEALKSLVREFERRAARVFNHRRSSTRGPRQIAKMYADAYRSLKNIRGQTW